MYKKYYLALLSFLLFSSSANAQPVPQAKTLLWKISGNGLTKPSYLYGTMHLQDRRLFYFTDSLYYHLEHTDGYAMEIDPGEMIDSLVSRLISSLDTTVAIKNLLSAEDYKNYAKKLEEKFGIPADKITSKKIIDEQRKIIYKFKKNDDMSTAMDFYLFNIAKKQGKWTGGIEDVTDQLNLLYFWSGDLKVKDLFLPDEKIKLLLDDMIKVYMEQDLTKLNTYLNQSQSAQQRSVLLLNRNAKMARRIDSLAHIRSTFFAIGAGHLPADSGVIDLLSRKGFTITPVISSKKINPDDYKYAAIEIPWQTVSEDKYNAYTIQMPGKPTDINIGDKSVSMKLYADLSNNTFYMTGIGPVLNKTNNLDSLIEPLSKKMTNGGKVTGKKRISNEGITGYEINAISNNVAYRFEIFINNETLYMAIIGGQKQENLISADAERFFNSFSINKEFRISKANANLPWKTLRNESKGFIAKFPATYYNITDEEKKDEEEESSFIVTKYGASDFANKIYYLVIVRDIKPGSYFHNDSLNAFDLKKSFDTISRAPVSMTKLEFSGINQYRYSGSYKTTNGSYMIAYMLRGNRSYTLFAMSDDTPEAGIQNAGSAFIDSFQLITPTPAKWSVQKDSTKLFSVWAPSAFINNSIGETQNSSNKITYQAYDESTCNTFEVTAGKINKYFWAANDSSYFKSLIHTNSMNYTDSLTNFTISRNTALKSAECIIKNPKADIIRKIKLQITGDYFFILNAYVTEKELQDENINRYFNEFSVTSTTPSSYLTPKYESLLTALQSMDSATNAEAKEALDEIQFSREDLPFLHKALFEKYNDITTGYSSVHRSIVSGLKDISDSTTVDFIKTNYLTGLKNKEELRLNILDVLANQKTKYSYDALKELLFAVPITSSENYYLESSLKDSLLLTRTLFPELLKLSADTSVWNLVSGVTEELLDSNILTLQDIKPFENDFYKISALKAAELKQKDTDYGYDYFSLIHILQQINSPNSNVSLEKFTASKNLMVRFEAAMALLTNNQSVNSNVLLSLAASDDYRADLYKKMEELKKLKLFPVKYLSQKEISKSEIKLIGSEDDEEPVSVIFIGEKTSLYKGQLKKFLLYKISLDYGEDEPGVYLGIAGPYDLKSQAIKANSDASGIYYDESFDIKKVDKQLKAYLKKLAGYAKENPEQD